MQGYVSFRLHRETGMEILRHIWATLLHHTAGPTVEMNLYGVSSFEKNHMAPSCIDPHQLDSSLICGQCLLSSAIFWGRILLILSPISCWLHISYLMMSPWFLLAESNVPSTPPWLSPQVEGVGKGIDGQQAQRWEGWARPVSGQYQASIPMFHVKMVKQGCFESQRKDTWLKVSSLQ